MSTLKLPTNKHCALFQHRNKSPPYLAGSLVSRGRGLVRQAPHCLLQRLGARLRPPLRLFAFWFLVVVITSIICSSSSSSRRSMLIIYSNKKIIVARLRPPLVLHGGRELEGGDLVLLLFIFIWFMSLICLFAVEFDLWLNLMYLFVV